MKRGAPRPIGIAAGDLRARVEPRTLLAAVQGSWGSAVGPRIAAEARPVRDRDGTITVECRAATWAQELDLLHDELRAKLNQALGEARVSRLRFVVGEGF